MQVLVLPINSVPITVSSWNPFAVSTRFHHKQAHPTVSPAPSIHTTTNLTHTQGFNIQYSNQAMSPPSTHPTAEQLSTTTSSLPVNLSATFPHPVVPQPPQVTTQPTPQCKTSHKAFHAFISTLPPSEQYFLGCYTSLLVYNGSFQKTIQTNLQWHQTAQCKPVIGSFAWVIYRTNSETLTWSSHNTIAKGHSDLSSFRTEACGYLVALYAHHTLPQAYLPPTNPVYTTTHIDNLGVVQRSSNTPFSIQQCLLPDWDILNKTMQVWHSILRVIKVQHVKGHQDFETTEPETLNLPVRLNTLADAGTHQVYTSCPIFHQAPFLLSTPMTLFKLHLCLYCLEWSCATAVSTWKISEERLNVRISYLEPCWILYPRLHTDRPC